MENPYDSPESNDRVQQEHASRPRWGFLSLLFFLLVVALFIPTLTRGVGVRKAARRSRCLKNLRRIASAIHDYESDYGSIPPAFTVDENGNRMHSWRTLILPYLEEKALYDSIDLTKPWDQPDNATAYETEVSAYYCPAANHDSFLTTYLAAVGPEFCFNGSTPRTISEIADGTARTVMVLDMPEENAVHWMSPNDADEKTILAVDENANVSHSGVLIVVRGDCSTRVLSLEEAGENLRAMLTIAGGEEIEE